MTYRPRRLSEMQHFSFVNAYPTRRFVAANSLKSPLRNPTRRCFIALQSARMCAQNKENPTPESASSENEGNKGKEMTISTDNSDTANGATPESSLSTGVDGGDNGSVGNKGQGPGDDGDQSDGNEPVPFAAMTPVEKAGELVKKGYSQVAGIVEYIPRKIGEFVKYVLKIVPAQVLVAILSVISTLGGTRMKQKADQRAKERSLEESIGRERARIESELRTNFQNLASILLKASFKLAERLAAIADNGSGDPHGATGPDDGVGHSATYSAYLLARYLAAVELLKKRSATLDLGFPAADRIFLNILGRVQGVLAADEHLLTKLQVTERLFKPAPGDDPFPGGPLKVMPRAQLCLGQLLLKDHWKMETGEEAGNTSMNSILSYVDFLQLLRENKELQRWFNPVLESFRTLERDIPGKKDTRESAGARLYFLQCALLDVVDFLDPGPKPRYVPMYKRQRLCIGPATFNEELEMPESLNNLYHQLATLRDNRSQLATLPRQSVVEVYVKAPVKSICGEDCMESAENGDCPFSQRVLLVLEEMNIPYQTVKIESDAKPSWFHMAHPRNQTPVIYHEGQLLVESRQIVTYLMSRFPRSRQLASSESLRLKFGSAKFHRFHPAFIRWLRGDTNAKKTMEEELRILNQVLAAAQEKNDGLPFLGGNRFSREDTAIVPFLHHVAVAGKEILHWTIPDNCNALKKYLEAARNEESFQKTAAGAKSIVAGYRSVTPSFHLLDVLE